MVRPLESTLASDPDSLNGAIIFHKDGYNMSAQCPALEDCGGNWKVLRRYDYEVVTVSELARCRDSPTLGR